MFDWLLDKDEEKVGERVEESKEVALVLSTGGARGLAHIGAIDQLTEAGYHIHSVAGTSMGALVGGMYAAGKLEKFKEWMATIDRRKVLSLLDFSLSLNHVVKGDRIINAMMEVVPDMNIEDLDIPYCAIATDAVTGTEVVFNKGSLYEAIRASISLPLFFDPVKKDNRILIDGGLINPLPLNRVNRKKGDILVGIDVSGHDYQGQVELRKMIREQNDKSAVMSIINKIIPDSFDMNFYTLTNRSVSIMIHNNARLSAKLTPPDILVDIPMNRYNTFDFDKYERLSTIGRNKTKAAIEKYLKNNNQKHQ